MESLTLKVDTGIMHSLSGISNITNLYHNLSYEEILVHEKKNDKMMLSSQGAMAVDTGVFTGRSPKDKFFVKEVSSQDNINWMEGNNPCSEAVFDELYEKVLEYLSGKSLYVFDGFAGSFSSTRESLRVISEEVWQHHFCTNMFISHSADEMENFSPEFTIYNASGLKNENWQKHGLNSEVFVIFHMEKKMIIIGGTEYTGEIKKGIFSMMNYFKPLEGILTMHCSANIGNEKNDTALFFGLSGTGKTTLSASSNRSLIGDDEHAWSDEGIGNIEGGCYAKVINLDKDDEPLIYNAIRRNALLENVVIAADGTVDYTSNEKTDNTRVSYPMEHIENRVLASRGGHPENIIFLTCDAFGVLPSISCLSPKQAMYHFVSGYTAKIAGTERGIVEPEATFSACFGASFMPLHPNYYAKLFEKKIEKYKTKIYLVNTGWSGGAYGIGQRMKIKFTRSIIDGIFNNIFVHDDYIKHPVLNLNIPARVADNSNGAINSDLLLPWNAWSNRDDYEKVARKLSGMFIENFKKYETEDSEVNLASYGPQLL